MIQVLVYSTERFGLCYLLIHVPTHITCVGYYDQCSTLDQRMKPSRVICFCMITERDLKRCSSTNDGRRHALAGLVASLQANELPNPVVEVAVVNNPAFRTYEVAAARTLQVMRQCLGTYCGSCRGRRHPTTGSTAVDISKVVDARVFEVNCTDLQ